MEMASAEAPAQRPARVRSDAGAWTGSAFGIEVLGPENRVLDNAVIHTFGTGTGISRGITFSSDPDGLAVNNRITQAQVGIFYVDPSTGKFRDNLTSGVTNPFLHPTTVIDAGGNN